MPTLALSYTDEQSRAITTRDVSVALAAGAGCGKTFVLTQRLLKELAPLDGKPPLQRLTELVAITFTEAAARELRTRVRQAAFEAWRARPDERAYWQELLRQFDNCRISTIHSFCSNLIRRYAFELGLDPLITVLDAPAAKVLEDEAIEDALRELLAKRDADIFDLATEWNIDGVQSRLAALMKDYRHDTFHLWAERQPEELVAAWQQYYAEQVWPLQCEEVARCAKEVLQIVLGHPGAGRDQRVDHLLYLLDSLVSTPGDQPTGVEVIGTARADRVPYTKKWWQDDAVYEEFRQLAGTLRNTLRACVPIDLSTETALRAADLGIKLARVAQHAAANYHHRKVSQGAIDFDDQLAFAHRLLTSPAFAHVQREARRQIRLLMIDEFQDTDRLQLKIVESLVGNVAESNRLFFVGDEKQSIYRFRKADPQVFRELQSAVDATGRLPLSKNFRSQPEILKFVNHLFGTLFGPAYQPLSAHREQVTERPCVEFLWTAAPDDSDGEDQEESTTKGAAAAECRRAEARTIAARLRELFDSDQAIVSDKQAPGGIRPARYGDVAMLFRALGDVQYYEEALRELGIDYYLVGGHAFYTQQEIFDILHLLRSVDSECDEVSLAGVLRSPFFALRDETLYWIVAAGGGLAAGLFGSELPDLADTEQQSQVVAARRILSELRRRKATLSVPELLELAFERTGYDAALLAEFMGERKLANVRKLIDQARSAATSGVGKLSEFVTQLSKFAVEQPKEALATTSPEAANVVRLMTVHQAKGLEFPVVVVPDIARRPRGSSVRGVFHPELGPLVKPEEMPAGARCGLDLYQLVERKEQEEESTRLFYVACTRAQDYLMLSAAVGAFEKTHGWINTLKEAFDLQSGNLLAPGQAPPSVRVVFDHEVPAPTKEKSSRRPSLARSLEKAMQLATRGPVPPPALAGPVHLRPEWITRFSVTRLSGQLVAAHIDDEGSYLHPPGDEWGETDSARLDPIGLGNLVHAVMERLDFNQPGDLSRWCDTFAPQHILLQAEEASREAQEMLGPFITSDRFDSMRDARWLEREVEFNLSWPLGQPATRYLQGYIDCLYEDSAGVLRIVDYKTNHLATGGVPQVARRYELQMLLYALAVEQALGRAPDEMVLAFLRPGKEHVWRWDETLRRRAIDLVEVAITEFHQQWAPPLPA